MLFSSVCCNNLRKKKQKTSTAGMFYQPEGSLDPQNWRHFEHPTPAKNRFLHPSIGKVLWILRATQLSPMFFTPWEPGQKPLLSQITATAFNGTRGEGQSLEWEDVWGKILDDLFDRLVVYRWCGYRE